MHLLSLSIECSTLMNRAQLLHQRVFQWVRIFIIISILALTYGNMHAAVGSAELIDPYVWSKTGQGNADCKLCPKIYPVIIMMEGKAAEIGVTPLITVSQVLMLLDPDKSESDGAWMDKASYSKPVTNISYSDAEAYISLLNRKTGLDYQLPSKSVWQAVCHTFFNSVRCDYGESSPRIDNKLNSKMFAYGMLKMFNGVAEMTSSCYRHLTPADKPCEYKYIMGGDLDSRVNKRAADFVMRSMPDSTLNRIPWVGFRLILKKNDGD